MSRTITKVVIIFTVVVAVSMQSTSSAGVVNGGAVAVDVATQQHYLELLCYQHFDDVREFVGNGVRACAAGADFIQCNRAAATPLVTKQELEDLKPFFGDIPFAVWVPTAYQMPAALFESAGLTYARTYPVMMVPVDQLALELNNQLHVRQIETTDEIMNVWAPLTAEVWEQSADETKKFAAYLLECSHKNDCHFYLGFYEGKPVAASLVIISGSVATVNRVSVLPEYRRRCFGAAITVQPLRDYKNVIDIAIFIASPLGQILGEKVGFSVAFECDQYVCE